MSSYTTAIVSITACLAHEPVKCTQSGNFQFDIKSPSDCNILSDRKLKTLFQKYKRVFTLASPSRLAKILGNFKRYHDGWQPRKRQFLSWIFQLAYFVKCKRTLLELNFFQSYPSSWREWILSLLVYVLIRRLVVQLTAKKCAKKCDARAKLLFCLVKLIAYLTFSSPPHL